MSRPASHVRAFVLDDPVSLHDVRLAAKADVRVPVDLAATPVQVLVNDPRSDAGLLALFPKPYERESCYDKCDKSESKRAIPPITKNVLAIGCDF